MRIRLNQESNRKRSILAWVVGAAAAIIGASALADRPFFRPGRDAILTPRYVKSPTVTAGVPSLPALPALEIVPTPSESLRIAPQQVVVQRIAGVPAAIFVVNEQYLNRLIAQPTQNSGPVTDCVFGARVRGEQNTQTATQLDFLPCDARARFDVQLQGTVQSRTTAVTPQAQVESAGRQKFDVRKSVEFDGARFLTRSPGALLDSCQQNLAARTTVGRNLPVVAPIADSIALNEANRRRPLAQQEAARRITARVAPAFNSAIDERLGQFNDGLTQWDVSYPVLSQFAKTSAWHSTDQQIVAELPPSVSVDQTPPSDDGGASLRVHETTAEFLATFTKLNGRRITVAELQSWIAVFGRDLSGPSGQGPGNAPLFVPDAGDATLRLADDKALTARFRDGQIVVTIRAAIQPATGVELPVHRVEIGYQIRQADRRIELEPLTAVVQAEAADSMLTNAVETLIQSQIQSRLTPVTVPDDLFSVMPNGTRPRLKSVTSEKGWLTVVVE